jgi:5'-deoxynucleotidase YfbR-like HD superfamily hydrolase
MSRYETELLTIAPDLDPLLQTSRTLNNRAFLRGRTGWRDRGVVNAETIYEHSLKVALAAYHLFETRRALDYGVSHDFPEILEPDFTPGEIGREEKRQREERAMNLLSFQLPNGNYWLETWLDYENRVGVASIVEELDKICPVIESIRLMGRGNGRDLEAFYPYARRKLTTPKLVGLLDSLWLKKEVIAQNPYQTYFEELRAITL